MPLPTSLEELLFCVAVLGGGALLFVVGNLCLRHREGGPRGVVLGFAAGVAALGGMIVRSYWPEFVSHRYPAALPFFVGCGFLVLAVFLLGVSIFGSDQRVRECFKAVLRGL